MGAFETNDCDADGTDDAVQIANCDGSASCLDCNGNGIIDGCDVATGCSADANEDGIPDECGCDIDVVFLVDASGSMSSGGELTHVCNMIASVETALASARSHRVTVLKIRTDSTLSCEDGSVESVIGIVDETSQSCTGDVNADKGESWASASEIAAEHFAWMPGSIRVIVPVSDEGPCNGDPCEPEDEASVTEAAAMALQSSLAVVFPVLGIGTTDCAAENTLKSLRS